MSQTIDLPLRAIVPKDALGHRGSNPRGDANLRSPPEMAGFLAPGPKPGPGSNPGGVCGGAGAGAGRRRRISQSETRLPSQSPWGRTAPRVSLPRRSRIFSHETLPSVPTPTTRSTPAFSIARPWAVAGSPLSRQASPFASRLAVDRSRIEFTTVGTTVWDRTFASGLLPTSPCGDAVASGFLRFPVSRRGMTFTSCVHVLDTALARAPRRTESG
jgi:hypothetical protein